MFLKRGVANVWYATLSASYLQNNEREWWGDAESLPARNTFLYVSVSRCEWCESTQFAILPGWVYSPSRVRSSKHFVHLSQWERAYMLTTSPKETKRTLLILKDYYSAWKGKLMIFLKNCNANWTWQWKYYHWFTFFDLVNTYRQMWPFYSFYICPASIVFPQPSFSFRTPDENDESRFHCIYQLLLLIENITVSSSVSIIIVSLIINSDWIPWILSDISKALTQVLHRILGEEPSHSQM
jgi:hypothetical protein